MERPRRPVAGRRSALRRSERVRSSVRRATARATTPTGAALTTRAAVLGLVLCALLVSAALPLREYLSQRSQIAELEQAQSDGRARVAALTRQQALLADPTYVASLARERLHFVRPGEISYVVLGAEDPSLTAAPDREAVPAGTGAPWWSQLYGSVRTADGAPAR